MARGDNFEDIGLGRRSCGKQPPLHGSFLHPIFTFSNGPNEKMHSKAMIW